MNTLFAFIKKEYMEHLRSGRLLILIALFFLFGIMNPAVAKLTPWLLEVMADSLAESGMIVTDVKVSAMDSWVQFFKNMPMGLIAFVLLEGGILTGECASGTLVLSLTKGLQRYKVIFSKSIVLISLWSVCYWLCFIVTYGYNAYFWDNTIAKNLIFSTFCWWVFGLFVMALIILFSAISKSNTGVLGGTGIVVLGCYLLALLPKCTQYMPTFLADGNSLIHGVKTPGEYTITLIVVATAVLVCLLSAVPVFNKRQL